MEWMGSKSERTRDCITEASTQRTQWAIPAHIKKVPLTEEDYRPDSPTIAGVTETRMKAREELKQEGFTTKRKGSKETWERRFESRHQQEPHFIEANESIL